MKPHLTKALAKGRRRLSWRDALVITVVAALWWGAIQARSRVIHPYCATSPQLCTPQSVAPFDRFAIGPESARADEVSFQAQGLSGILAVSVPIAWTAASVVGGMPLSAAILAGGTDLGIFLETTAWNGLATETARLTVQRPRPFVYLDPIHRGAEPSHYVSFYSGHTSFAAAATVGLVLTLAARSAPFWSLLLATLVSQSLILTTALGRIYAGRHFPSDVLAAAIAGTVIAIWVARRHQKRR